MTLELTGTDRRILNFIRDNPGQSKEEIVRAMGGNPSRITTLKRIGNLHKDRFLTMKKDKPNSQLYRIYLNEEDIKGSLYQELSKFRTLFSRLLESSIIKFEEIESRFKGLDEEAQWPWIKKSLKLEEELLCGLLEVYILIHSIYTVVKMFQWRREISNKETISEVYSITHEILEEVQQKLFDKLKRLYVFRNYDENEMAFDLLNYNIKADIRSFSRLFGIFQHYELEEDFAGVMELIWNLTSKTIPLHEYAFLKLKKNERNNWRIILSRYTEV